MALGSPTVLSVCVQLSPAALLKAVRPLQMLAEASRGLQKSLGGGLQLLVLLTPGAGDELGGAQGQPLGGERDGKSFLHSFPHGFPVLCSLLHL